MFTGLDFLNQNFSYDLGCIRSKWCCCDHINRPRINILQHSSFRKPILATLHNIVLNFSPEQAWAVACLKHVSVFWDIWSFFNKENIFLWKAILSYDKILLKCKWKRKTLRNFIGNGLCNNQNIICEHVALVYILRNIYEIWGVIAKASQIIIYPF